MNEFQRKQARKAREKAAQGDTLRRLALLGVHHETLARIARNAATNTKKPREDFPGAAILIETD
jgi:hypothetical protein